MARISLNPPQTLGYRLGARFSRHRYGVMLDPGAAIGHNMQVGRSYAIFEMQVARWRQLDRELKDLAVMAVAATIGCAWCMDFGYWETTVSHAVPEEKIRETANWRDSKVFSELELLVMEYAEAMTATPPGSPTRRWRSSAAISATRSWWSLPRSSPWRTCGHGSTPRWG